MAEKEQKKVIEKDAPSAGVQQGAVVAADRSRKWVIAVVIGAVVLYAIIAIVGVWALRMWNERHTAMTDLPQMSQRFDVYHRGMGERTFTSRSSSSDGLTTTTTTTVYTQTQGVVTKVDGDTITVAGGGKTQTIKTDASTTYSDDTKPAVNDTVVIVGTKDSDTITATQVAVYNYQKYM